MTDDTPPDDITKEQLWKRLRRLEEYLWPDRREVLKMGGAAAAGAAGVYGATGGASATDDSAGQLGAGGKSQDIVLDEIKDPSGDPVADLDDTGLWSFQRGLDLPSVNTGVINNGGPVTDGDEIERQIWVIVNGASDPAGADPEDIILEEEA